MSKAQSGYPAAAGPSAGGNGSGASSPSLRDSAANADGSFSSQAAAGTVQACSPKTWVGIELLDKKTGQPISGCFYRIELPDGRVVQGTLDANGTAGVTGIDPGTCTITFPNLDAKSWKRVG